MADKLIEQLIRLHEDISWEDDEDDTFEEKPEEEVKEHWFHALGNNTEIRKFFRDHYSRMTGRAIYDTCCINGDAYGYHPTTKCISTLFIKTDDDGTADEFRLVFSFSQGSDTVYTYGTTDWYDLTANGFEEEGDEIATTKISSYLVEPNFEPISEEQMNDILKKCL